jgi:tetratricopeptide (TPR) repeat protein
MNKFVLLSLFLFLISCKKDFKETHFGNNRGNDFETISALGDTLRAKMPSPELIEKYEARKEAYERNPDSLDLLIWYGRFTAYTGQYREAVSIYTKGLEKFPNNSRLLRHRGHRYITLREFDKAISDLSLAAQLIEGTGNKMEEDGMPNNKNIPVSSQHGNIFYHLGLAYYLDRQLLKSLDSFKKCLSTSNSPDNVVAATHWIYMIQNRLGRKTAGDNYLRNITADMDVIENTSYYKACLFYKGLLSIEEISAMDQSDSALRYAFGNWIWYNGNPQKGQEVFREIIKGTDWESFGYIAAETDLAKPYVSK